MHEQRTLQLSKESCTCTEGRCHADEEQDSTEQSLCRTEREMQGKQPNREEPTHTHTRWLSSLAASASRKPAEFGPRRKVEQPKCLAQRQSCSMTHSPTHTLAAAKSEIRSCSGCYKFGRVLMHCRSSTLSTTGAPFVRNTSDAAKKVAGYQRCQLRRTFTWHGSRPLPAAVLAVPFHLEKI